MNENNLKESALQEYIAETEEMLERTSLNLSKIEKGLSVDQVIDEMYRDIHSIKGSSYLFGCKQMGNLAHAIESSLDPIRSELSEFSQALIDSMYRGLDLLKELVNGLKQNGEELDIKEKLEILIPEIVENTLSAFGGGFEYFPDELMLEDNLEKEREQIHFGLLEQKKVIQKVENKPQEQFDMKKDERSSIVDEKDKHILANDNSMADTIKVPVGILDKLMNLVGELVLIRNQHLQFGNNHQESALVELNQRLNVVTCELQDEVMKTRMQPIGTILSKYHRVVRDLSRDLGKSVNLVLDGTETELDKTLLEAVKDPIMHIVRNAVDHGIETLEERADTVKNPTGTVKINSFHEGGQVIIEIQDDGRGLSREKIAAKVLERGLCSPDRLEKMSDRDVFMFIFAPGFSTAERVSNVSGRGVGMDVVKTNIERIGGMIDLNSVYGVSTTIRLKIPLTLAIIPALIVTSGSERFAIPQVKLVELVRVEHSNDPKVPQIEYLQGKPVYRLRGQLLPLVSLNEVLSLQSTKTEQDCVNIVVLNADGGDFGLVVDEIENSADVVIKPLMQFIKDNSVYSGATVMGDGSVALTIDVVELSNHVGIFDSLDQHEHVNTNRDTLDLHNTDIIEYLLLDVGMAGKYSMPLCLVNRLEEFNCDRVEVSGDQRVVQYRDHLLPLISVPEYLTGKRPSSEGKETISVIVVQKSNRLYGIEVERIVDIFRSESEVDAQLSDRDGLLGSMLVGKDVVAVIDVFKMISDFVGEKFKIELAPTVKVAPENAKAVVKAHKHILLVDDNAFFRNHVAQILANAGFEVTVAKHGQEGFELLKSNSDKFSAVVSDIEMPILNGYEMAIKIKSDESLKNIPLMAITTKFRQGDITKGYEVGFVKYLEKLDPDQLLIEMANVLDAA